jgi:membrane associated rhomboid family serine protease
VVGGTYWATLFGGIIPGQKGVSWDGHLFGAIAGVLVALVTAKMLKDDPTTSTNQYDRESKY